jgi:NAD(P)-dependent dehydrogenase (short-subunit alcohol dehydrogenase family)
VIRVRDLHDDVGGGALMSRILVTGSADGLGRLAAESLQSAGHHVVCTSGTSSAQQP